MTFFVTKVWMDYIIREKVWHKTLVATISILLLVSSLYFVFDDIGDELSRTNKFDSLVPYIALSILIPDFLLKYFVKRESLIMSDSMKTRPISTVSWNRFVLLNSLLDFWNLYLLFLLFPIAFLSMSLGKAVLSSLLFFSICWLNGYAITVYRLSQDWEFKALVLVVGLFWVPVAVCYVMNPLSFPWALHIIGFVLLCMLMIYGLYKYSCTLHGYADYSRSTGKEHVTHFSWLGMEYVSMMRATRYRLSPFFFIFNSLYGLFLVLKDSYISSTFTMELIVVLSIIGLPTIYGLRMFGFEGNYMDGLWTRPIEIRKIMQVKYNGYVIDAVFMTILCYTFYRIFRGEIELPIWFFLATLLFTLGVTNHVVFFTSLVTKRCEMFSNSFSLTLDRSPFLLYVVVFLPIIIVLLLIYYFLPTPIANIVSAVSGIIGILLHPFILKWFAQKYESNRYKYFERYRN